MSGNTLTRVALACALAMLLVTAVHAGASDAWISTKVKMSLIASSEVGGLPIEVDTDQGRVTLNGKVPTKAEKEAAGRIASRGTGVVSVRNLLQIVADSDHRNVDASDDEIKAKTSEALKSEPALANSDIAVKSVNKGVVMLTGGAKTLSDHLLAVQIANDVPGTRRVVSEVKSPDQYADREIWYDDNTADHQGNAVTDGWITTQIKMSLMTDKDVPTSQINVDTRRGVVTLFGTVPSAEAKSRATEIAKGISGVSAVKDELRVVAKSEAEAAKKSDADVESAVKKRVANAKLTGADIKVDVKDKTARLSGTVKSAADSYTAVSITYGTPGVQRVVNDVNIEVAGTTNY